MNIIHGSAGLLRGSPYKRALSLALKSFDDWQSGKPDAVWNFMRGLGASEGA